MESLPGYRELLSVESPAVPAAGIGGALDFRSLYDRLYGPVGSYLMRRIGCAHATEDLLGDVFLAVLRALPRYRDRGRPVDHWVFRIATNAANRWLRRQRSERRVRELRAATGRSDDAVLGPSPLTIELERRELTRRALQALPEKLQEVAALHYLAGLSLEEVAATLRRPIGTIKSRLGRALAKLRQLLPPEDDQ